MPVHYTAILIVGELAKYTCGAFRDTSEWREHVTPDRGTLMPYDGWAGQRAVQVRAAKAGCPVHRQRGCPERHYRSVRLVPRGPVVHTDPIPSTIAI